MLKEKINFQHFSKLKKMNATTPLPKKRFKFSFTMVADNEWKM
jgi:hypothetical protein